MIAGYLFRGAKQWWVVYKGTLTVILFLLCSVVLSLYFISEYLGYWKEVLNGLGTRTKTVLNGERLLDSNNFG